MHSSHTNHETAYSGDPNSHTSPVAGLRERVATYGGELQSGARPDGGYALRVRLPLAAPR